VPASESRAPQEAQKAPPGLTSAPQLPQYLREGLLSCTDISTFPDVTRNHERFGVYYI